MWFPESSARRTGRIKPARSVPFFLFLAAGLVVAAGSGCSDRDDKPVPDSMPERATIRLEPHPIAPDHLHDLIEREGRALLPAFAGGPAAACTAVGPPHADRPGPRTIGLFGPDGSIEVPPGGPHRTVWIYRIDTGSLHASTPGSTNLSLASDYCPVPKARWPAGDGLEVETELISFESETGLEAIAAPPSFCYRIRLFNSSGGSLPVRLLLVRQPYRLDGSIEPLAGNVEIGQTVLCNDPAAALRQVAPHGSDVLPPLAEGHPSVSACWFDLDLPSATGEFSRVTPVSDLLFLFPTPADRSRPDGKAVLKQYTKAQVAWEGPDLLNAIRFTLPDEGLANTYRAALAQLLIAATENGIGPNPASADPFRCIETAAAAAALNRAGHFETARRLLRSFSKVIGADGRIPERIDADGSPSPPGIHEPNGRALFSLVDHFLFTQDRVWLEESAYPIIVPAADHLLRLLDQGGESGLLPAPGGGPEGQASARFADSFWALEGLEKASLSARLLGDEKRAALYDDAGRRLGGALEASVSEAMKRQKIAFIPSGPDGGLTPHDALSNGACAWPGTFWTHRTAGAGRAFELYWETWFLDPEGGMKADGSCLSAGMEIGLPFLTLRMRKYPHMILEWYGSHFTSPGFHTWGEIISRDPGMPEFSRAPSLRAAADYITLMRNIFVMEEGEFLFLAPGITYDWFKIQDLIGIRNAPTRFGPLSYSINNQEIKNKHEITGEDYSLFFTKIDLLNTTATVPKGYLLRQVYFTDTFRIKVNGKPYRNVGKDYVMIIPANARTIEIRW